jgi:hypothetical protein
MKKFIGCDAHARYSIFVTMDELGRVAKPVRVNHGGRELRDYLATLEPGQRWQSRPAGAGIGFWMSWRPRVWMRGW